MPHSKPSDLNHSGFSENRSVFAATDQWGLRRMAPYPAFAPSYARVELDPATQTGRSFDAAGRVMEMPGHGTSTDTKPATNTGNPSDGSGPGGSGGGDQDSGNDEESAPLPRHHDSEFPARECLGADHEWPVHDRPGM
ncbi:putative ATP-grasp-modified RiPP [Streptomyces incanus]|uniref:ATP-grasp-modified RiPP n=1 Tax=Streptomyces incanus TaxID=887453 RepID=A0ABW0XWJ1_9ACTN